MTLSFSDWQSGQPLPKGWDAADAVRDGWVKADLDAFMRDTVKPWEPPKPTTPPEKPAERREPSAGPPPQAAPSKPVTQARTVEQAQPATVTSIQTRKTVQADDAWMIDLVMNDEGRVKPKVTKNWALFLENHPKMKGVFAFDAFKMKVMLMRRPPWAASSSHWEPRPIQDSDYAHAVMWLEGLYMTPTNSGIAPVIATVAEQSKFDRLTEYLEGLKWDGTARIGRWLSYYLGTEDSEYNATIGLRFLVSAVARGLAPGVKVDTMPILEGPQGARKSTALRDLFGAEFFTDELSDIGSKDAMMELQGVWGLEVAEMHRFNASETNAVKKFLSRQTDRYRPPYGRSVVEVPRRVVLAGTINPEGNAYLKDPTGARRFWPVEVGRIDLDALIRDRDQLWAEAVTAFRNKVPHWVQEHELDAVELEQEKRTDVDVWMETIGSELLGRTAVYQSDVLKIVGVPIKDADYRHAARIGRIMKKLGWSMTRERRDGSDQVRFVKKEGAAW